MRAPFARILTILCTAAILVTSPLEAAEDPLYLLPPTSESQMQPLGEGSLLAQGRKRRRRKASRKKRTGKPPSKRGESAPSDKAAAPVASAKTLGAAVRAGYMYLGPGFGAEAFYILSPDLQIGGQFLIAPQTEVKASGDALYLEYATIAVMSFGARARYFVYGSFYLLGGGTFDQITGRYGFTETATEKLYYSDYTATAMMLQLGIGNMFKFGDFVLGADWFTFVLPLSLSAKAVEEVVLDENGDPPAIDPVAVEGKELAPTIVETLKKQLQFQAVMIYAGYTF